MGRRLANQDPVWVWKTLTNSMACGSRIWCPWIWHGSPRKVDHQMVWLWMLHRSSGRSLWADCKRGGKWEWSANWKAERMGWTRKWRVRMGNRGRGRYLGDWPWFWGAWSRWVFWRGRCGDDHWWNDGVEVSESRTRKRPGTSESIFLMNAFKLFIIGECRFSKRRLSYSSQALWSCV